MEARILQKGEGAYVSLECACHIMNDEAKTLGYKPLYEIGNTYLDFGLDWKWTTIIYNKGNGGFQALYPAMWKKAVSLDHLTDLREVVRSQANILVKEN